MYDFGIEEKEFQLMLDVANEKMELNSITFNLVSDTMRRVRDSGKLDDYTRAQVGLLCDDFSIATEKFSGKTEYEVAIEEMSGGMMALVAAAILVVSGVIAKVLGFFSGTSSSSSGGGGGGGNAVLNIEKNKKAIDETKGSFNIMNPEISYLITKLEKIEKEIDKVDNSVIDLVHFKYLRETIIEMKRTKGNIFMLIPLKKYDGLIRLCNENGGRIFINGEFSKHGGIKNVQDKIDKMMILVNKTKEEILGIFDGSKMDKVMKDELSYLTENNDVGGSSPLSIMTNSINELTRSFNTETEKIFANNENTTNESDDDNSPDYGTDRSFMNNIIFKRDEYPNIFNTFSSEVSKGSDFIKSALEMVVIGTKCSGNTINTIKSIISAGKETLSGEIKVKYEKDTSDLLKSVSGITQAIATGAYKSMHVIDSACGLTRIFFDTLIEVSTQIVALRHCEKLNGNDLFTLVTDYYKLYSDLMTSCRGLKNINYVKDSQLDSSRISKLVKHISSFGISSS